MIKRMRYPLRHFENEGREATVLSDKRAKRGFSLMETLAALLIVVMLTGFVATSLPVAFRTYRQVVGVSNAQAALSTTASALRDELGMAVAVKQIDGVTYYQTSDGLWASIDNAFTNKPEYKVPESYGLVRHVYRNNIGPEGEEPGEEIPFDVKDENGKPVTDAEGKELKQLGVYLIPSQAIKGASGGEDLRVEMNGLKYSDGKFTDIRIEVFLGESTTSVEKIENYTVKAVLNPKSA